MGIIIGKTEGGDFPALDLGWIEVRILDIKPKPEGTYGPQLLWVMETLESGPGVAWDKTKKKMVETDDVEPGLSLWGWTSQVYSDYPSKAYRWAREVQGSLFDPNADFNSDNIIGCAARIKVDVYKSEKEDGEVVLKNKVLDVAPSRKFERVALATQPEEDEAFPF